MRFLFVLATVLLGSGVLTEPRGAQAADCVKGGNILEASAAICGSLKIVDRRRDDPRPNIDISATYAEFDPARNAAEHRYNEWVRQRPGKMNFTGSLEIPPYSTNVADTMAASLYRSKRLLSASISGWVCCGAHGFHWDDTLNIDTETGRDIALGDLVRLTPVANFCWQQFSSAKRMGQKQSAAFVERYPLDEPFADSDLAIDLKAIAANRQWTTKEVLVGPLLGSTGWNASQNGLVIYYGELVGYWAGHFNCVVTSDELREFVKPGVSIPP